MSINYRAYVVFSGSDEDYEKHGVFSTEEQARDFARHRGWKVDSVLVGSKEGLEDLIEDNLTDDQADDYKVKETKSVSDTSSQRNSEDVIRDIRKYLASVKHMTSQERFMLEKFELTPLLAELGRLYFNEKVGPFL
jgi:hypothetical protein